MTEDLKSIYDKTAAEGKNGEWGQFVDRAKQSMQGHIWAEQVAKADFSVR